MNICKPADNDGCRKSTRRTLILQFKAALGLNCTWMDDCVGTPGAGGMTGMCSDIDAAQSQMDSVESDPESDGDCTPVQVSI